MIYFDNAATTFPKPKPVIDELIKCVKTYCGNPGRSSHQLAIKSSEKIYETRESVANFLNYDYPENVVFTMNASYALNTAIKTSVSEGDHILISDHEHNSVLRPVAKLANDGIIEYDVFETSENLEKSIEKKIKANTRCIVANLISNVTGEEIYLKTLYKMKQKYNLLLIIDASQIIGHKKIDLKLTPCDVLCAPSHKALFGIQGAGFCLFCDGKARESFIEGGSGSESISTAMPKALPEHFEAGTLPTPAIATLNQGIKFINAVGIEEIEKKITSLSQKANEILLSIPKVKVYGASNGIVSFSLDKIPSNIIADELNKRSICVRGGLHCSPMTHKKLGTLERGTVRISFSYMNKKKELTSFYKAMREISEKYQ